MTDPDQTQPPACWTVVPSERESDPLPALRWDDPKRWYLIDIQRWNPDAHAALLQAVEDAARLAAVEAERDELMVSLAAATGDLVPESKSFRNLTKNQLRLYARRGRKKLRDAHLRTARVATERDALAATLTTAQALVAEIIECNTESAVKDLLDLLSETSDLQPPADPEPA